MYRDTIEGAGNVLASTGVGKLKTPAITLLAATSTSSMAGVFKAATAYSYAVHELRHAFFTNDVRY